MSIFLWVAGAMLTLFIEINKQTRLLYVLVLHVTLMLMMALMLCCCYYIVRRFLWIFMFLFCLMFAMSLCASVYMCFVVTCWEKADLLALVCGV